MNIEFKLKLELRSIRYTLTLFSILPTILIAQNAPLSVSNLANIYSVVTKQARSYTVDTVGMFTTVEDDGAHQYSISVVHAYCFGVQQLLWSQHKKASNHHANHTPGNVQFYIVTTWETPGNHWC